MIQLWYQVWLGDINSYFIRTDSSLWRKVLNATADDSFMLKRFCLKVPEIFINHTMHQTEPFPLLDILLSHKESKEELMHKCREQCAAIPIQQEKQGPKQENQNIHIWPLRPCILVLNCLTKENIQVILFMKMNWETAKKVDKTLCYGSAKIGWTEGNKDYFN